MGDRRGYKEGPSAGAPGEGPRGAPFWINNCQNSLKTRLKYIKIILKVDFIYKKNQADL